MPTPPGCSVIKANVVSNGSATSTLSTSSSSPPMFFTVMFFDAVVPTAIAS